MPLASNMTYKVVYYIDSYNFGGAEKVLYTLIKRLDRSMWNPNLIYHPAEGISDFIDMVSKLGIETTPIPVVRDYKDIKNLKLFVETVRELQPDIFHANLNWMLSCTSGIIAAFLARTRVIIGTQHLYTELKSGRDRIEQRLIASIVDAYITVSNDVANNLSKVIHSKDKINVIYNGIETENCKNADTELSADDPLNRFTDKMPGIPIVLTVARLDKQKGHIYLLDAVRNIPNSCFVFVGDGPYREKLEATAMEFNVSDRVLFLGTRHDIFSLLKRSDLFVLPSLYEGMPLSIMEAMAAGKPVIASDIGGVKELVQHGETGILVPPGNTNALASAINTLLMNHELASSLAASGEKLVLSGFSADRMVKDFTDLYSHLLAK